MTIEQGVGQAVVKIRTSPYSLIQPFAMLGLFIVLGVFTPIGGDNPLDQALNLSLFCMWGLVVAVSLWGLTWGVGLTPESANVRWIRRRSIPWQEVQAVLRYEQTGSSMVRLILENGKPVTLRAPARLWGLGGAAYDRDFHRIGQWWLAHRGESWRPVRTQTPRPPSRELFLQHEGRGAMPHAYPVRLEGRLDHSTSRWVWVVKWLLVVPHIVVLVLLCVGAVIAGFGAFFAILLTGRYPRALFDYNVGVLRWAWRVSFYAFGAFATDRYPPFTLEETTDYPARLDVAYPEHLNRWLVLVKWFLAVPHLMVVGVLIGAGFSFLPPLYGSAVPWSGWGLITTLAVVNALILLFSGRYPKGLFDLLMGLNRWVYRVLAYMLLMTDEYPPFRLDGGGDDPRPAQDVSLAPESRP
jgi:hypothetical protein